MADSDGRTGTKPTPTMTAEKRQEILDRLDKMNTYFQENKERIYLDKVESCKKEMIQVQKGSHKDFESAIAMLTKVRETSCLTAQLYRDYQLDCANHLYQVEHESIIAEYLQEKQNLRDKMLQSLEEKKRKLRDERDSFDLDAKSSRKTTRSNASRGSVNNGGEGGGGVGNGKDSTTTGAETRKEGGGKRKKAAPTPIIPFLLKEHEIFEDFSIFRKGGGDVSSYPPPFPRPSQGGLSSRGTASRPSRFG